MESHKAKKVVIITEATILDKVTGLLTGLGAGGYTVQSVEGKGEKGESFSDNFSGLYKCIRLEVITNEDIAQKISLEMVERFLNHYSGIIYMEDVEVIRAKKFGVPE